MTRIDTTDQLNALPIGSVIGVERRGEFTLYTRDSDGWWACTTGGYVYGLDVDHLPAALLHVPGRDLVQEAQANAWDQGYARGFYSATPSPDASENPYRDEAP